MKIELPTTPGTYMLLLNLHKQTRIRVGRLGVIAFKAGWYIYTGSALGSGGLAARVSRHLRQEKKYHWHIDYLRYAAVPKQVGFSQSSESLEHQWADRLFSANGVPISGFGSTDCRCRSHLYFFQERPANTIEQLADATIDICRS